MSRLLACAVAALLAACTVDGGDRTSPRGGRVVPEPFSPAQADGTTRRIADITVRVEFPEGIPVGSDVVNDAEELKLRLAHALVSAAGAQYFDANRSDREVIDVVYKGKARTFDRPEELDTKPEGFEGVPLKDVRIPRKY